ncbi:MAG: DUF1559 domain-containing protein [Planctomycetota bacterium]|nr:DUF1559 domain-containing protein [Planctomycetota bacterium]
MLIGQQIERETQSRLKSPTQAVLRAGFTLVEMLVVISIIGILVSLLLPAVSAAREAARRAQCSNNLKQLGLALQAYHAAFSQFPSGYIADVEGGIDGKSWGWGVFLLPFVEQTSLHDRLAPDWRSLDDVATDPHSAKFLLSSLSLFVCPSDTGDEFAHPYRSLFVSGESRNETIRNEAFYNPSDLIRAHLTRPPGVTGPVVGMRIAKSNYVGSHGSEWKNLLAAWKDRDFHGNGLFGRNSAVNMAAIIDGSSNTIALGERSTRNYAAVWAGMNSWRDCGFTDNQMVLGTSFYPINDAPFPLNIDCDGRGSVNYSSYHTGGSNFVFADGSVHFLSQSIESQRNGVFHRLAQRNDGEPVGDF